MTLPRRILIATDFSDAARTALVFGARLAAQCQAELHLLHVEDPLLASVAASHGIDLAHETREELHTFVASAWPAAECAAQCHVVTGEASDVILHFACREAADVVVIGARGMSGTRRLVFGSTAERVLRRADRPVLIVPDRWLPSRPDTYDLSGIGPIVVGLDFSTSSVAAAAAACGLAESIQTSVDIVHIVPALPVLARWQPHADAVIANRIELARRDLALVVHQMNAVVPVQWNVDTGDVATQLAEAATTVDHRHPMLVLGRLGAGASGRAPGTIAYRVLTLASVPVLVHATAA